MYKYIATHPHLPYPSCSHFYHFHSFVALKIVTMYSIHRVSIETTVVSHESRLDEALSWLLRKIENQADPKARAPVGFGIEKSFTQSDKIQLNLSATKSFF